VDETQSRLWCVFFRAIRFNGFSARNFAAPEIGSQLRRQPFFARFLKVRFIV
jgi:hypothetical protein